MSAKFVLLKLCLNGIERWLPAKRSKDHRCKTSYSRSERKFLSSEIDFWTFKRPISVKIWTTFSRIWAQWSVDWRHVWLALSVNCRQKCSKFNASKQAIRDQSASFNQAKYFFGHVNDLFQLKNIWFYHGQERNICFTETMFDWLVVFFIFFYSINKNIFSSDVLVLPVKLEDKQICFLNHPIA